MSEKLENYIFFDLKPHTVLLHNTVTAEALRGSKTIYLIDEVVYVDQIEIDVTIGDRQVKLEIPKSTTRGTPLAFHYEKFALEENGTLGDNVTSQVNPLAKFMKTHEKKY